MMFGWLVKMLLQTPVQSSGCACCEGKRQRLEKMRREIVSEETDGAETPLSLSFSSGTYSEHCGHDGCCSGKYHAKISENADSGDFVQEQATHCCSCGSDSECGSGCSCGK